jgi:hypothetical protein
MNWGLIVKQPALQLAGKKYNDIEVKMHLRAEGGQRCVYCSINESIMGGYQFFWVEHHKPQSVDSSLENDLNNLFYSCQICNRFKSNDWPNEPDTAFALCCYPNPTAVDYKTLFDVGGNGRLSGVYTASKYLVERIYLNRPQLIMERRRVALQNHHTILNEEGRTLAERLAAKGDEESNRLLLEMVKLGQDAQALNTKLETIPPYEVADVTRQ